MVRILFEQELREIRDNALLLGSMAQSAIERAVETFVHHDTVLARRVVEEDSRINEFRFAIEESCIQIMATQQPIATDLRTIVAVLNIISDLERMADHGVGIAKITLLMDGPARGPVVDYIGDMASRATTMLHDSLTAFTSRNVELARELGARDDEVDALYDRVYASAISMMVAQPEAITALTYHLWTAHNLERVADRATNIAERVVFLVTGRMDEFNVSRY